MFHIAYTNATKTQDAIRKEKNWNSGDHKTWKSLF
jgi:hypothetical protein